MGQSERSFFRTEGDDVPSVPLPDQYQWVRLSDAEAGDLIDLVLLKFDLEFAKQQLEVQVADLESGRDPEEEVGLERRARWNAALMAYVRAFATGARLTLDSSIYSGLDAGAVTDHEYFVSLRNRHVAHSVSDYEQVQVAAALTKDHRPRFVGVTDVHVGEQHPHAELTHRLLQLVVAALRHVEQQGDTEKQRPAAYCRRSVPELTTRARITALVFRSQAAGPQPRPSRRSRRPRGRTAR